MLREYFPLVKCYKKVIKLSYLNSHDYFKKSNSSTRFTVEIHSRFVRNMQKLNAFKYSFFVRIIKEQVAQQPFVKLWLDIS